MISALGRSVCDTYAQRETEAIPPDTYIHTHTEAITNDERAGTERM